MWGPDPGGSSMEVLGLLFLLLLLLLLVLLLLLDLLNGGAARPRNAAAALNILGLGEFVWGEDRTGDGEGL